MWMVDSKNIINHSAKNRSKIKNLLPNSILYRLAST